MRGMKTSQSMTTPNNKPPRPKSQSLNKKLRFDFQRYGNQTSHPETVRESLSTLEQYIKNFYRKSSSRSVKTTQLSLVSKYCEESSFKQVTHEQPKKSDANYPSLNDILSYHTTKKSIRNHRPQSSMGPLNIPINFAESPMSLLKRASSARPGQNDPDYRVSKGDLPRAMRKELSLMSSLLQPCSVQKKVISSRLYYPKPDPEAITSSRQTNRKPYIHHFEVSRLRPTSRNIRGTNKFHICAWDGFGNQQPEITQ